MQLRSRPTTETLRPQSPSPFATPALKSQVPTIRLTTATPCDADSTNDATPLASRLNPRPLAVPIAPKPSVNGGSSRKRLVPKKSRLSLLGQSSSTSKAREQGSSELGSIGDAPIDGGDNGFEIYVDPANDPEIGDVLMVKKKKSRLGLDGLQWGTLGEVTNVPPTTKPKEKTGKKESLLKAKVDENQKWWSIGRGRRDSKEKEKDRAKPLQQPDEPCDRTRYDSMSSSDLLTNPVAEHPKRERLPSAAQPPASAGLGSGKNSVAIRAMRSVRSLARIGSWAQLKNTPNPDVAAPPVKDKEPDEKKKKKKRDKEKEKEKERSRETVRYSGSSFEAGALSASPASKHEARSLGKKKASVLGLGLPSTIRLPSSRSGSAASSIVTGHRLSLDSANALSGGILARERSGSTMSTATSLRPMSAKSRESSGSSGSGAASVRWDEAGLQTMKEIRRKDKEIKSKQEAKSDKSSKKLKRKGDKGSNSTREVADNNRRRTPLVAIFPGSREGVAEQPTPTVGVPVDGFDQREAEVVSPMETPMKRGRPRPTSDQPLGQSRPKPLSEGEDAISLLDAATNDLAQLINRLDLEATPGSIEMTPIRQRSPFSVDLQTNDRPAVESPVKDLRRKNRSQTSLKPYAHSISKSVDVQLGQNIAPWATLNAGISPSKPSPSTIKIRPQESTATIRGHKRAQIPPPVADPSPVFKALRPAASRLPISKTVVSTSGISPFVPSSSDCPPSTLTFGSRHSKSESRGSLSASPVFKKAQTLIRKRSSLAQHTGLDSQSLPIPREIRRNLGLSGTMGGSVSSIAEQDFDGSDPDSDIPDELQMILSNSDQEDTLSFKPKPAPPSPGLPPALPLPVLDRTSLKSSLAETSIFQPTMIDDEHDADAEEAGTPTEDDTKKSFDFTGELRRLHESGVSDRRSFIEQLESAFRTPAKVDLRCDFQDLPPVPKLPTLQNELSRLGENSSNLSLDHESHECFPVDVHTDPSLLPGLDSYATTASVDVIASQALPSAPSVASRPSVGELNPNFRFGGRHSSPSERECLPLTLSDIIPPPEVARSLSMASLHGDESPLMNSILAHAVQIESPPERQHDPKREVRDPTSAILGHHRNSSALSFTGFDSFAEVRRGFEFSDSRPGFYPPPGAVSDGQDRKHESLYSIASVSSYGNVLHAGSADPFDYGSVLPLPSLKERPSSDDFSFTMSTSIDDTFSFLRRQPRPRVDSDASSFYFRAPLAHPYNRTQRRPESGVSVGPPISLFNRNSTYHRRGDSNTSISSIVPSYANCRRFSWGRRRSNVSVESLLTSSPGMNFGRPGLGDKMLDSALEQGSPLTSISPSPPCSFSDFMPEERAHTTEYETRASYDSVIDSHTGSSNSDSAFFEQDADKATKPPRYRPISSLSIPSVHSPPKEDDTMISMLGGGHVRRRSVTSMIGGSPCIQAERRKNMLANPPETVINRIQKAHPEEDEAPKVSRVLEAKPSIASTTNSSSFGDERMIRAKHGLLERHSLEDTALTGDGEDLSGLFRMPVFHRPTRANRSRSSTCTSSSGAETPPLSISDGYSSFSDGSLSSIDLSHLNTLLSDTTHPLSNAVFERARPHARGHHRRRISQARASRTSIYEIIEEELNTSATATSSPVHSIVDSAHTVKFTEIAAKTMDPPQIYVVDPETSSVDSYSLWDDEQGISALRRYYALRDEAEDTITESKRTWSDTPFSTFAVQSFDPPRHPSGMRALLEHSLQNYGPLPSELRLRHVRSRVNSRPSPYPRTVKTSFTSSPSVEHLRATVAASLAAAMDTTASRHSSPLLNALQPISIDSNISPRVATKSKDCFISPHKAEHAFGLSSLRDPSTMRRMTPGWSKKGTGRNGTENKENHTTVGNRVTITANTSQGTMATSLNSLRLNRPRPKGRPMPASARPIRA